MTTLHSDALSQGQASAGPSIRIILRDGAGGIHFDWPVEQIRDALDDEKGTLWVDIEDPDQNADGRAETLMRDIFGFHPLAIEDAIKETHVPKVDDWGSYL